MPTQSGSPSQNERRRLLAMSIGKPRSQLDLSERASGVRTQVLEDGLVPLLVPAATADGVAAGLAQNNRHAVLLCHVAPQPLPASKQITRKVVGAVLLGLVLWVAHKERGAVGVRRVDELRLIP
eukprot:968321-Pleurochrysis_carterae.AAC.3